jgi:Ni2+-binding GTPase involved in maturation of urease and hydrogenase
MQLHLVGGFLGSGKTTAIVQAAKSLLAAGNKVGVVTNDQGKYLVDTAFVHFSDLPAVEVGGGCFCCNYEDLNDQLRNLIREAKPDVVFAESVGSCADIVATVVKPLLALGEEHIQPSSFSVFVDSRLYLHHLLGDPLPFSEDVVYIFGKQIEEAGLLVINKVDLLDDEQLTLLEDQLAALPAGRLYRFQNSLVEASVREWVAQIQSPNSYAPGDSLDLDYERYGRGEAQLAWLDETLILSIPEGDARMVVIDFFQGLLDRLAHDHVGIGHLKFILGYSGTSVKISFTGITDVNWQTEIPAMPPGEVHLLVNARVETSAQSLRQSVVDTLHACQSEYRFSFREEDVSFFHPGKPQPTHRMP